MSTIKIKDSRTQELVDQALRLSPSEDALMAWFQSLSPEDRKRMEVFVANFAAGLQVMMRNIAEALWPTIEALTAWYEDAGRHVYQALVASGDIIPPKEGVED